jgi:Uma2 family endonuclease
VSEPAAKEGRATAADLAALPDDARAEVVAGEVVPRAAPSFEHGDAQRVLAQTLGPPFVNRGGGGDAPGGWWIGTEVEIELESHEVYVPDLVGWRRQRVPERPSGRPVRHRPDWVCEIISPSTASRDRVLKHRVFHRAGVPHYWIVDPDARTLTVHRHQADGYLVVLTADESDARVRAEPFDAIELPLAVIFGADPDASE